MAILERPEPGLAVHCPACKWGGTVKDAKPMPDCLVVCPECEMPVEKVTLFGLPIIYKDFENEST